MKQNRWFILALCFLLLNGVAVFRWLGGPREAATIRSALVVPESGRVAAGSRDELRWRFTAPMATTSQIGQWTESGPVRFLPEIDGEYCWVAPDELAFRPRSGWPPCSRISAITHDDLRGLDGRPWSGEAVAAFETTPLALVDVRQSSLPTDGQLELDLEFNAPVMNGDFYRFLKLETPDGKPHSFSGVWRQSGNCVRLSVSTPAADELVLTLKKDLPASVGPLGLEKDEVRRVKISRELAVLRVVAESQRFAMGQLEVMLNGSVDLAAAKAFIRIEPGMDFSVEPYGSWGERQHFRILGEFKPGQNYSVTFLQGLGDGQVKLAKDDQRTVYFPLAPPAVEFVARGTYLSTQGNLSIPIKAVKYAIKNGKRIREYVTFDTDDGVRWPTKLEDMAKLRSPFKAGGNVTAANSSQMTDGAAFSMLMTAEKAKALGLKPIAKLTNYAVAGCKSEEMGVGPAYAIPKVLKQAGMTTKDIDVFEINEAFASQAIYSCRVVGIEERYWAGDINPNGGAIALGHPLGMSGARLR